MYKSKLQELCQRQSWELPDYATAKDGLDHMPRFTATVTVCGQVFETPSQCKSSKEAQNTAARIAYDSLTAPPPAAAPSPPPLPACSNAPLLSLPQVQPLAVAVAPDLCPLPLSPFPSSLPDPPPGLLAMKCNANTKPAKEEVLLKEELMQENVDDPSQCSMDSKIASGSESKDILHMYKNLLQQHVQKENAGFPVYTSEAQGPPHARRFKSKVTVSGKSYETTKFFTTLKEAEQIAARIACRALSVGVIEEEKGLYKNLVQELVQKKGLKSPSYETVSSGLPHKPVFVANVVIGFESFQGVEAKSRKQAEINAAEVAYCALTKGCPTMNSSNVSFAGNASHDNDIKPTVTSHNKHQTTTDGEDHLLAKRAKFSLENVDVNVHLQSNPPPHDSNLENAVAVQHVPDPTAENNPSIRSKTVVFPRNLNWPIPENASVMPFSNEKWVAYKLELDHKPAS